MRNHPPRLLLRVLRAHLRRARLPKILVLEQGRLEDVNLAPLIRSHLLPPIFSEVHCRVRTQSLYNTPYGSTTFYHWASG